MAPLDIRRSSAFPHFPSIGSDDPPLGVENVKIRENSEKIRGPPTILPFLGPWGPR